MRLINADGLKEYIDAQKGRPFIGCTIGEALKIMTDEQPTVDAVPVRHGRWKAVTDDGDEYKRICSCCGEEAPYDTRDEDPLSEGYYMLYPYCPHCGAKMDGKDGEHEQKTE